MRRALLAAVLLTLAVATAGCAIPTQGTPSAIAKSKVPFNLMDPNPPSTTTTQPPNLATYVPVKVYFLDGTDKLVDAPRVVPPPAPLIAIIRALLSGPTATETTNDISTAIPSNVKVLDVSEQPGNQGNPGNPGNIVTVNLNGAFGEITGINTQLAVGQIVATVVNEAGSGTGVVFEIEGERISVPIANGSLVAGPVYVIEFLTPP